MINIESSFLRLINYTSFLSLGYALGNNSGGTINGSLTVRSSGVITATRGSIGVSTVRSSGIETSSVVNGNGVLA